MTLQCKVYFVKENIISKDSLVSLTGTVHKAINIALDVPQLAKRLKFKNTAIDITLKLKQSHTIH